MEPHPITDPHKSAHPYTIRQVVAMNGTNGHEWVLCQNSFSCSFVPFVASYSCPKVIASPFTGGYSQA